jgi:hypothetical protein
MSIRRVLDLPALLAQATMCGEQCPDEAIAGIVARLAAVTSGSIHPQSEEHAMTDAATPETATASENHDLNSAARAIEKLIRRQPEPDSAEQSDDDTQISTGDDTAESVDDEDEDADDEGGSADDGEAGDGDAEEPRYVVKIKGQPQEVGLKELIKGYQRGADYTRKTMRLADERRELDRIKADVESDRANLQLERQRYAERLAGHLPSLRQQLAHFEGVDWARLSSEHPQLFAQAKPLFDSLTQQLQQAEGEQVQLRQLEQQRQHQAARAYQDYLADQKRALIARHPEMADPATGRQETAKLARYLSDAGYRQEELSRLVDHRDFILARKAMLYDRLMADRDKVKETLAALPRVQRPGTARSDRQGAGEGRAAAMRRLERSGRTEDAARLIEELI